jgi:hypothetical protein
MGVFGDLWKRMTSGATSKAAKAATEGVADKLGAVAEGALDDAEAVLAQKQKELAERNDGIVLPSTEVDDPDWLQEVRDTEAAHRNRQVAPEPSTESQEDESSPEQPSGPTAEDRARARLARMKQEMQESEE